MDTKLIVLSAVVVLLCIHAGYAQNQDVCQGMMMVGSLVEASVKQTEETAGRTLSKIEKQCVFLGSYEPFKACSDYAAKKNELFPDVDEAKCKDAGNAGSRNVVTTAVLLILPFLLLKT